MWASTTDCLWPTTRWIPLVIVCACVAGDDPHIHPWTRSWDGVAATYSYISRSQSKLGPRSIERRSMDDADREQPTFLFSIESPQPTHPRSDLWSIGRSIGNRMPSLLSMPLLPPQAKNIFPPIGVYVRAYRTLLTKQMFPSFHVHELTCTAS
jgi:hypothetical protein